jgi:hypothetical protein
LFHSVAFVAEGKKSSILDPRFKQGMDERPHIRRPPSYSDSLLFMPDHSLEPIVPLKHIELQEQLLSPRTDIDEFTVPRPIPSSRTFTPAETWFNRLIGFAFHITLIGLFETIFFFQFVSVTEDTGLEKMVNNYVNGILTSCGNWTQNTTLYVNEVLSLLINTTTVAQQNQNAASSRNAGNRILQIQAWLYVASLGSSVIIVAILGHRASLRLAWKRILLENAIMVTLLGIYEYVFFRTIIYNYNNLSLPELNEFVVTQLQQQCGLLTQ